jgi:secondary thiamine-phosphate synthase enzyme
MMSNFKVFNTSFSFPTRGEIEFVDLTDKLQEAVANSGVKNGLVHVFAPHATGVLILTENDYSLLEDIKRFMEEIVPDYSISPSPFSEINSEKPLFADLSE